MVKTVDHTKKLKGSLLTGADALMKAIQKPIRPKKKKIFGCRFCKGIFVSSSNLNKHVATYHVPGAKPRITRESSLICINCSKMYKNEASLIKHAGTCVSMIRVHTDMDIAVEEPEFQSVSRNLIEEGSYGIPISHVSNAGPHRHIAVFEHTVSN